MLESKAQAANQVASPETPESAASSIAISQANLLRIETSRAIIAANRSWFADFDFLVALAGFFGSLWGTDRVEMRPIPIRMRDRL